MVDRQRYIKQAFRYLVRAKLNMILARDRKMYPLLECLDRLLDKYEPLIDDNTEKVILN